MLELGCYLRQVFEVGQGVGGGVGVADNVVLAVVNTFPTLIPTACNAIMLAHEINATNAAYSTIVAPFW